MVSTSADSFFARGFAAGSQRCPNTQNTGGSQLLFCGAMIIKDQFTTARSMVAEEAVAPCKAFQKCYKERQLGGIGYDGADRKDCLVSIRVQHVPETSWTSKISLDGQSFKDLNIY